MEKEFRLRKLEMKDAPLMLEWMHDDSVVHFMDRDFGSRSLSDCEAFIRGCADESESVHRAVVGSDDEYLGTVSLKNINREQANAEFAITIRKCAMGTGASAFAMREMIDFGFRQLSLEDIYWYVSKDNVRALRFYDKNGYRRVTAAEVSGGAKTTVPEERYVWYNAGNPLVMWKSKNS